MVSMKHIVNSKLSFSAVVCLAILDAASDSCKISTCSLGAGTPRPLCSVAGKHDGRNCNHQ